MLIPVHLCEKVSAHIDYSGNFLTFLHPLICDMHPLCKIQIKDMLTIILREKHDH